MCPKRLTYAINSSEKFGNGEKGYTAGGLSISYTLEYAYTEWATAKLAGFLGNKAGSKKISTTQVHLIGIFSTAASSGSVHVKTMAAGSPGRKKAG